MCIRDRQCAVRRGRAQARDGCARRGGALRGSPPLPRAGRLLRPDPSEPGRIAEALQPFRRDRRRGVAGGRSMIFNTWAYGLFLPIAVAVYWLCLLYTSDAADERSSVDLG